MPRHRHPQHHHALSSGSGRHENGQNFLVDRRVVRRIVDTVASTTGPIVEIGCGDGALTLPLSELGRPVTGVEIDADRALRLRERVPRHVTIVPADVLRYRLPERRHVLVGNVPFHLTTAILRRVLAHDAWSDGVFLVQWEVARRRAGVGGATLMTAAWWPWFEFEVLGRVPATAFRPVPGVDGGLLRITRRPSPLVSSRSEYQRFVGDVFQGRGRGLPDVLRRTRRFDKARLEAWLREQGIRPTHLPKHLNARQWAELWSLVSAR